MNYVIIGNSIAAVGAVEGIRQVDADSPITIVGKENHPVYARPLISYLLEGKTDEARMRYRPQDFYEKNGVRLLAGRTAEAIDPESKKVLLSDGSQLAYDRLLCATGSAPFVPPFAGLERVKRQFTFLTLDDARALEAALTPQARVLIVGAGLIGLKCAEGIAARVGRITVMDLSERILSSILDERAARQVQEHIQAAGVNFRLGTTVKQFYEDRALLESGEEIPFDVLVLAVGVRPAIGLLKDAGADVNRGIVTDSRMQTNLEGVYAAGDCVESYDVSSAQSRVLALLPNAYMQGQCAGLNMAGGEARFDKAIPMNAIGFFGLHMVTAGSYTGECIDRSEGGAIRQFFVEDGLLKGFILTQNVEKAGVYTALIRERTPLSSIDFDLMLEKPGLKAFSRKYREQTLGGISR